MNSIIAIIPARYGSTRLNAKPLIEINGKSILRRVWEATSDSKLVERVIVATDDDRIKEHCKSFNAECVITSQNINSGTDRIYEVLKMLNLKYDITLNIQGDEPLLKGSLVDMLIEKFINSNSDVGTIIKKITNVEDIENKNIVKVILDKNNNAIYFSRSPIPFVRDIDKEDWLNHNTFYKHIGIYAYKNKSLIQFVKLPQSKLELAEKLEQLRLLEDGAKYFCLETNDELIGVDTKEDLLNVKNYLIELPQ